MEAPSFGLKGIHIANDLLKYFYLGLLVTCFLLALGNRPQGSKHVYTFAIVGFGLITVYMTVRLLLSFFSTEILMNTCAIVRCVFPRVQGHRTDQHGLETWTRLWEFIH